MIRRTLFLVAQIGPSPLTSLLALAIVSLDPEELNMAKRLGMFDRRSLY